MNDKIEMICNNWLKEKVDNFSGVLSITNDEDVIYQQSFGFRNRAEQLLNEIDTAFAIPTGTKFFIGLAVCKLLDEKKISLDDILANILSCESGAISSNVTIKHLLTHNSGGVGIYINEESEKFLKDLYAKYPGYLWETDLYSLGMSNYAMDSEWILKDFFAIYPSYRWETIEYNSLSDILDPNVVHKEKFRYSCARYVLLILVIEAVSGTSFQQFVEDHIILPCGLERTGFYSMNELPANTAIKYMFDADQWWQFNTPVLGEFDCELFSCVGDWDKLWRAIFDNKILSSTMRENFFFKYVDWEYWDTLYTCGLGINATYVGEKNFYQAELSNPFPFLSSYFPYTKTAISVFSNSDAIGAVFNYRSSFDFLINELQSVLGAFT